MNRIQCSFLRGRVLLLASVLGLLQTGASHQATAQNAKVLQQGVSTGIGCAPSNNGTAHVICAEELANAGGSALLGGVSWQLPDSPSPSETLGNVDQISSVDLLPNGPFTGTPGCAQTNDNPLSGTVICAVEGANNGLYGIAIHPEQPNESVSSLVPLLMPGQVIFAGRSGISPCSDTNPCDRVGAIASNPSCASTEGSIVICAVSVLLQNTVGAAETAIVGLAFDPRQPLAPPTGTTQGTNPSIVILANAGGVTSDPSCTDDVDVKGVINNGKGFAACSWVFQDNFFGATATLFGASFDPRSGYNPGALTVAAGSINNQPGFPTNGSLIFTGDPSCATPRDGDGFHSNGEITCAIGVGFGNGFTTGTENAMLGVTFDPVHRTTATLNLGSAPSGEAWTGVSCASPNDANDRNSVACIATTGTTNSTTKITTNSNTLFAINFDPRTGFDPTTNAAPQWSSFSFVDPADANALPTSLPSCVTENVIKNQISCGIVDSADNSVGFFANPH